MRGKPLIDISLPLREGIPTWPGSVGLRVERVLRIEAGDPSNVTRLDLDIHVGTHVESSLHFRKDGAPIESIPLEVFLGPAYVAHLPEVAQVGEKDLRSLDLPHGTTRLLLRTRNSEEWKAPKQSFRQDYVGLTADGARWVVDRGIRLVGADYLSIASFPECAKTHEVLLSAGVAILEGLNLSEAAAGTYELICLPLRLPGAEGAPARAVLRPMT